MQVLLVLYIWVDDIGLGMVARWVNGEDDVEVMNARGSMDKY